MQNGAAAFSDIFSFCLRAPWKIGLLSIFSLDMHNVYETVHLQSPQGVLGAKRKTCYGKWGSGALGQRGVPVLSVNATSAYGLRLAKL